MYLCPPFFSRVGGFARRGKSLAPPGSPAAARFRLAAPRPPLRDSAGLSPIDAYGASEKCACSSHGIHTSCTVFPQPQNLFSPLSIAPFIREFYETFASGRRRKERSVLAA